jgi:hypothetical protein
LNAESAALVDAGKSKFPLAPADGPCRVFNPAVPEACVALDEAWFLATAGRVGLKADPVRYGEWAGRPAWFDFQDVVVLRKP